MNSDYKTKLMNASLELYEKGIPRKSTHTLVFKFLRLCGLRVRLPAYSEPRTVLIYTSVYFTALIAGLYGYVQYTSGGINLTTLLLSAVFFGCLAGAYMMWLTGYTQKKYELTPWEEL